MCVCLLSIRIFFLSVTLVCCRRKHSFSRREFHRIPSRSCLVRTCFSFQKHVVLSPAERARQDMRSVLEIGSNQHWTRLSLIRKFTNVIPENTQKLVEISFGNLCQTWMLRFVRWAEDGRPRALPRCIPWNSTGDTRSGVVKWNPRLVVLRFNWSELTYFLWLCMCMYIHVG